MTTLDEGPRPETPQLSDEEIDETIAMLKKAPSDGEFTGWEGIKTVSDLIEAIENRDPQAMKFVKFCIQVDKLWASSEKTPPGTSQQPNTPDKPGTLGNLVNNLREKNPNPPQTFTFRKNQRMGPRSTLNNNQRIKQ